MSFSHAKSNQKVANPTDMGVINQERILYWLEKRGELLPNASEHDKQQALEQYLANRTASNHHSSKQLNKKIVGQHQATLNAMSGVLSSRAAMQKITSAKKNKAAKVIGQAGFAVSNVKNTVKVLAIMIDFQDLKHSDHGLNSNDTDMYYDEYPITHYNNLLFSQSGFVGPNNNKINSAYQYYQKESGESLLFTGDTFGWITADNDAKYYGSNNNDENDSNVAELVIEAVTKAVAEKQVNLSDFDKTDYFDRDNDGNINEPDGIVDHIMIFHSSIGEESGGGKLGTEAIWSHRFFVFDENNQPISIAGSTTQIFGYTITPLDASPGVVVHEFGHDLGVPDEYDTGNDSVGAPVQAWSVMGSGSWLGNPRGSEPVGFSPYAKEYFQTRYDGNWVNQQKINLVDDLNESHNLVTATNYEQGFNQLKINLPKTEKAFALPFSGTYQYYSNEGHLLNNSLSFTTQISGENPILTMKARWDIEQDYDYVLVNVNDETISGNHTKTTNEFDTNIKNFISGKSSEINNASSPLGWVDLSFDLSNFANQNVKIEIIYVTDTAESGYGFVVDELKITSDNGITFSNGAETLEPVQLNGFSRVTDTVEGSDHFYYVQLRNHSANDSALVNLDYDPGVLLWYRNVDAGNNNVSQHAGEVFIGVVDADQNLIKRNGKIEHTEKQLRDAAFSLYNQTFSANDTARTNNATFNDTQDYSAPLQPESGIKLPKLGLRMEVTAQASDSSTATILLTQKSTRTLVKTQSGLRLRMSIDDKNITNDSTFLWMMGDGTTLTTSSVDHLYKDPGNYEVSVIYSTIDGNKSLAQLITLASPVEGNIEVTLNNTELTFSALISGGLGEYNYRWVFGDGEGVSTQDSGRYNYKNAGNYTVTLTVIDETGEAFVFNKNITVDNPLTSAFTTIKSNLMVNFNSNVSGGSKPYSYAWDFGNSQTSSEEKPELTYTAAGTYNVRLTITDADNKTHTVTNSVTVSAAKTTTVVTGNDSTKTTSSGDSGGAMYCLMLVLFGMLSSRQLFARKLSSKKLDVR